MSADSNYSNLREQSVGDMAVQARLSFLGLRYSEGVPFSQGDSTPHAGRRGTRACSTPGTEGSATLPSDF